MALDEALLEVAECLTLRLYGWQPPAVSLGYFQEYASIAPELPPGMDVVRRITGGGAIWHEHEVTYSLIGWLGRDGLPGLTRELYAPIHGAIRAELARHGAALKAQPETVGDRRYREEPRCFASPAADDLVHADGGKSLGSAARARGQRVLMHGSLKLASNPWDGAVVSGCGLDATTAAACLVAGISSALGQTPTPGVLTALELATAQRIVNDRYATTAWVQERTGPRA
jgi:lipoyl(octanoyl) transferase